MAALAYFLLGFLPPLIAGPLAGFVFVYILKRGKDRLQVPFWGLLVVVNLLIASWMAGSHDEWFPVQTFTACLFTPSAAIITVLVMRVAWRKLKSVREADDSRKGWYIAGMILIPLLQLGVVVALWLLAPTFCGLGWLACQDW